MPTKIELQAQLVELQEALEEAGLIIDSALGIERDDSEEEEE